MAWGTCTGANTTCKMRASDADHKVKGEGMLGERESLEEMGGKEDRICCFTSN